MGEMRAEAVYFRGKSYHKSTAIFISIDMV